ncbi:phosphoribosylanthranilate isomerase [Lacibacter cauensis]|uniref:N-(5'-phosphoribosyl)anthranilate isomerase n=2 Tax=Lacibacter cauensis TaxID=510947 RepID=A0A562SHE3_9BACT|nr:phosphoribosylanthranilate isomerase [Lacibacter cauensis]
MTELEQLQQLGDLGVEFAGMIFYHKSPRFVLRTLTGAQVKRAKLKVYKVGVFVNASYDEIMNHVENFGLDLVQLHGDETPRFCEQVSEYIQTIKAFRITEDDNIPWKIKDYVDACDMYMFDTMGAGYGGTGKKFDWSMLKGLDIGKPFFLSGGIEPTDAAAVKEFANEPVAKNLFALDMNSKFEISPGIKDMELVKKFVEEVRG